MGHGLQLAVVNLLKTSIMTVLIAGATGLIGKRLSAALLADGHQVHFLTRSKAQLGQTSFGHGFHWDPSSGQIDTAALDGVSKIVNLAGSSVSKPWTKAHKKSIIESRVAAAGLLHSALSQQQHQVTQYLSASGIAAYASDPQAWYTESAPTDTRSFLGQVVQQWEAAADRFKNLGIQVVKLRIGLVLAKEGGAFPLLSKPVKLGVGSALGDGQQWQSWIHIDDLVGQIRFLLESEVSGIYNGVGPNPVTQRRFLKLLAARCGRKIWLPAVPVFALRLLMGERADIVLDSQRVSAEKIQDLGYQFRFHNLESALDDLLTGS